MKPSQWQIATLTILVIAVGCDFTSITVAPSPTASATGGVSAALDQPLADGTIVLLRKGDTYGAFIPVTQNMSPETVKYEWYLRSDAQGTFDTADAAVQHGTSSGTSITFGPFAVEWSGHTSGSGWIYYDKSPDEATTEADIRICVTSQRDLNAIDGSDAQWNYKASNIDAGIPGGPIGNPQGTK